MLSPVGQTCAVTVLALLDELELVLELALETALELWLDAELLDPALPEFPDPSLPPQAASSNVAISAEAAEAL